MTPVVLLKLRIFPFEFLKKFETAQMEYSPAGGKLTHERNRKSKISWHCLFNIHVDKCSPTEKIKFFPEKAIPIVVFLYVQSAEHGERQPEQGDGRDRLGRALQAHPTGEGRPQIEQ